MTEDQAKSMRCCGPEGCGLPSGCEEVRHAELGLVIVPTRWCIGSECMAWRVSKQGRPEYVDHAGEREVTIPQTVEQGYCGLAGSP